jgi:chaperonin GroEL
MPNPRLVLYGADNRQRLLAGAEMFSKAVCVTYGPQGRNAVLDRAVGLLVTKDGVTVAREIHLSDPVANMACQALKEACIKVNDEAGDGTTTAACVSAAILRETVKLVEGGFNPIHMARGVQMAANEAIACIYESLARPIENQEQLEKVALIASNGDQETAAHMAEAVMAVGKNGTVSIEDGNSVETTLVFKEGMEIDRGVASVTLLNGEFERTLDGPLVACIAASLTTVEDVLDLCEEATTFGGRPLVVFCEGISGEALKTLVMNDQNKDIDFEFVAILAPGNFDRKKEYLGDIAALAGADLIDPAQGMSWKKWNREWFGGLRTVRTQAKKSTLIAYDEAAEVIAERIAYIQAQYQLTTSQFDTDRLNERLAVLEGGLCIMQIGAHTEIELKEKRARVEDALGAVQSALEDGIVPGGGTAYIAAHQMIKGACPEDVDPAIAAGWRVMERALLAPLATLAANAGLNGEYRVEKLLDERADDPAAWLGWDAVKNEVRDFGEDNTIIDPTRVAVTVIESAASSASTLMTSEASVSMLERAQK